LNKIFWEWTTFVRFLTASVNDGEKEPPTGLLWWGSIVGFLILVIAIIIIAVILVKLIKRSKKSK